MKARLAALAASIVALVFAPSPVSAVETFVVAGPASLSLTYATPVATVQDGGSLTFLNLEFLPHDVVHDVGADGGFGGPSDQPWCSGFEAGKCPLFWSDGITLAQRTTAVLGVENLEAGRVYSFYCRYHPPMKGKLVVLPQA